ncbi:MAG: hypothetical protein O2990_05940 [Bacteroidetes bacterium]|nr:hypothetical protein [Bacteroidota bacterium]
MNSLFSDALFSCHDFPAHEADGAFDAWAQPRPSSISNILRFSQSYTSVTTSLGEVGLTQN